MATISRGAKVAGGTDFTTGAAIASEVNTDLNTAYTEINGGLGDANMSSDQKLANDKLQEIASSKVGDYAATDAEFATANDPGDTGSPNKPTTLQGELSTVRYQIKENAGYFQNTFYRETGGSMAGTSWTEPPIVGRNLLPNPGFELQSGAANSAPDGWTLVNTPTIAIESAAVVAAGLHKRSLRIKATTTAEEGILYTARGLRASTKYIIGMAYTLTFGEINLDTTGALGSGDYQNIILNASVTGATTQRFLQAVVQTTSTPADVVVRIVSTAADDDFNLLYVWMYELGGQSPAEIPHIPLQAATDATELEYPTSPVSDTTVWQAITPLALSQYIPTEGYRLVYEVTLSSMANENRAAPDNDTASFQHAFRVKREGTIVEGPVIIHSEDGWSSGVTGVAASVIVLKNILEFPTPGTTYDFTVEVGVFTNTANDYAHCFMNPLLNSIQGESSAKLYTERL